jgi:hypothetical protein
MEAALDTQNRNAIPSTILIINLSNMFLQNKYNIDVLTVNTPILYIY